MNITIVTLFPKIINIFSDYSVIARAIKKKLININTVNIRDFSKEKHKRVDDYIYGGGAGMLIKPQCVYDAITYAKEINKNSKVIYLSPKGSLLNNKKVKEISKNKNIILLCGHYEGIDCRVIAEVVDESISIGDYILTGGEIPALVLIDSISRFVPKVLNRNSLKEESFEKNLLEYPQYTRPRKWHDKEVPKVLLSGNHEKIKEWRKQESINITKKLKQSLLKHND